MDKDTVVSVELTVEDVAILKQWLEALPMKGSPADLKLVLAKHTEIMSKLDAAVAGKLVPQNV